MTPTDFANIDMTRPFLVKERNIILLPTTPKFSPLVAKSAKVMVIKGMSFYAVKNGPRINALLWRMGHQLPSPIYFDTDYDWSSIAIFSAQAEMAGLLVARRRAYNLSAVGTGKTIGSLLAADWLIRKKYVTRVLVLSPLSTIRNVWEAEIYKHMPRLRPIVLHGTKAQRIKLTKQLSWNIAILNHDGLSVIEEELHALKFDMVIIDEIACFRDTRTRRWKLLHKLLANTPFAAGLTGSPTPNAPSDAYGIARLMTPERVPMSFRTFRNSVEVEVSLNRWIPRANYKEVVYNLLQPAVRFTREEIVELKDLTVIERSVSLSAKQVEALMRLKKDAIATYPEGIVQGVNAAVLANKMLQVCCGAVYTADKTVVDLEPTERLQAAKDLIEEADGKVLLFVPYKHVAAMLVKQFKGDNMAVITGEVDGKERDKIFKEFQDPSSPLRLLIAVPSCLAHGITLTEANHVIWWSPLYSRETYEQANGRITRIGQTRKQLIFHLCGDKLEKAVYDLLERKGTTQDAILAMFET
jgi:SNF2 family DNA or RNA helicase